MNVFFHVDEVLEREIIWMQLFIILKKKISLVVTSQCWGKKRHI